MSKNCANCFAPMERDGFCPQCGFNNAAYQPEPYHLPPGTELRGRYLIGRVMGEGGFGITYAGYDPVLRRKVAIKEFYPNGAVWRDLTRSLNVNCYSSNNYAETFRIGHEKCLQEAQSLARLDDIPAIVRIIDYFSENNTAYLIMEFVEGVTLRDYARKQPNKLTLSELVKLLTPITEALEDVHRRGFVHRDISPDNIMVTPNGKTKLLDFGAVKQVTAEGNATKTPIVKRGFSPLELYSTAGLIGPWTDVYALAATIFFLLTGEPLDEPANRLNVDTAAEKLRGVLAPPQIDAMLHALAVQHKNRQSSVTGFVRELMATGTEIGRAAAVQSVSADDRTELNGNSAYGQTPTQAPAVPVGPDGKTVTMFDTVNLQNDHTVINGNDRRTAGGTGSDTFYAPRPAVQSISANKPKRPKSKTLLAAVIACVLIVLLVIGGVILSMNKKSDNGSNDEPRATAAAYGRSHQTTDVNTEPRSDAEDAGETTEPTEEFNTTVQAAVSPTVETEPDTHIRPTPSTSTTRVPTTEPPTATTAPTTATGNGLNSTNISEVVAYYNAAHAATKKAPTGKKTMKLDGAMTGDGVVGTIVKILQGPAEKALAKNSTTTDYIPGHPPLLVSDVKSAKATSKNGVTTIEIKLKDQVDGPNASNKDGPSGRGIGTLGSIDTALNELGMTIESGRDTVKLTYNDAYIKCTVNEKTGQITGGTWHYKANVFVGNAQAKLGIKVTLKNFKAKIDYKVGI